MDHIPVCFEGVHGPDIGEAAQARGLCLSVSVSGQRRRMQAVQAGSGQHPSGGNIKPVCPGLLRPPPNRSRDLRRPRAQAEQKDLSSVWDWQPPGDLGGSGAWTVVRELALTLSRWPPRPPPPLFMHVCRGGLPATCTGQEAQPAGQQRRSRPVCYRAAGLARAACWPPSRTPPFASKAP